VLRFNDGVNLDTSGPLRAVCLHDGWYVLGNGWSIPCNTEEEAQETIRQMSEKKGEKADDEKA
jgi:hypothetical protein